MRRYLNVEAIVEGLSCLLLSGRIFYLAFSGKYLLFVTPKIKPYLYFASVVLLIWAVLRLLKAGKPKYKIHLFRSLVVILPLMAMFLPYNTLAASSTQSGYSNVAKDAAGSTRPDTKEDNVEAAQQADGTGEEVDKAAESEGEAQQTSPGGELKTIVPPGLDEENRTITVSDEDFYQWLVELSYHPEKYEGFEIHLHGTIYRDETMAGNEFALTRLLMSCCAADLAPCGPICLWDEAESLESDKWVNVIGSYHFDQEKGMEISVSHIEDAQPAEEEYVYPFSY
ncbi:MAG: TIGR03943 family protein [Ruminococcus sp.]|nr:TIGR03943 family protein [Ruminococcus sp.]